MKPDAATTHPNDSSAGSAGLVTRVAGYLAGDPRVDAAIEEPLLQTVLDRRIAILAAWACSTTLALATWYVLSASWAAAWALADLLLLVSRWEIIRRGCQQPLAGKRRAVYWLLILGLAWALCLGLGIYGGYLSGHPALMILATAVGAGVVGVAASRNAATPRQARLLIACVCVPAGIGLWMSPLPYTNVVAVFMLLWMASLYAVAQQNFEIMVRLARSELATRTAARTDALTGLPNRLAFNERLARLHRYSRHQDHFCLLYLDLDKFKAVNDNYSHAAGDELLHAVARRMQSVVRRGDVIYRLGGDEFAVVLPDADHRECTEIAQGLIASLSSGYELSMAPQIMIGVSIGSASSAALPHSPEEVLRSADAALNRAKASGRGMHIHAETD